MPAMSAFPKGFHHVPKALAQRRWALWLLLTTGCGFKTALDVPGTNPSVSMGGAGSGGLTGSGGAIRAGGAGGDGLTGSGGAIRAGGAGGDGLTGSGGAIRMAGVVGTTGVVGNGGTSGESGGTGSSPPSSGCAMDANHPGYLHCGPWNGYAWATATETDQGSSISPSDFASANGLPFCAKGVLARDDSAVGLLGFNVNQSMNGGSPGTWAVTGKGLKYELSNPGGSPLRIQIQGAKGWPEETWCADISGSSSGSVVWSSFNTMCWAPSGPPGYDGQTPLEKVMLLVPGINGTEQPFNVCLIGLYPY